MHKTDNISDYGNSLIKRLVEYVLSEFEYSLSKVKEDEAKELLLKLKQAILSALLEIEKKILRRQIAPDISLRLSPFDAPLDVSNFEKSGKIVRVGFLATTADPLHWGHILLALRAIEEFDLQTVILQVMGDHPHKKNQKCKKEFRHSIARYSVESFYPLIRYTPLGYDNLKLGEENAAEFLLLNHHTPLDLYLIIGGDAISDAVMNVNACNQLLSVVNKEEGRNFIINILIGDRNQIIQNDSCYHTGNILTSKMNYPPLPRYKNQELSSTLFRSFPDLPLLPSRAFEYINENNLYHSIAHSKINHANNENIDHTVLLSYLSPRLHSILEKRFSNCHEIRPLIPHGPSGISGVLGTEHISLFKASGKETAILPVMQKQEVKTVFAIGLCGALQTRMQIGDIIIPLSAIRGEGITPNWADHRLPAIADFYLLESLHQAALRLGFDPVVGSLYTTASLVRERQILERFAQTGVLGIEMELALHYILATLYNKKAASLYCVSDNVALNEEIYRNGILETESLCTAVNYMADILENVVLTNS